MQNSQSKKILVIGPSWLGDMIMSQALFKVLKSKLNCIIDVIAPEWSRPILDRMQEVSKSIPLPVQHGELALQLRYQLGKELRKEKYDQAIVLTNSWKSALVPFWAHIPLRTGWLGELRWGLLNDVRYLDKKKLPLMMQRYVALGCYAKEESIPEQYLYPELTVNPVAAQELLTKFNVVTRREKILALCPGAAFGSAKRWPANYFAEIAKMKINEGWDVWLFGSKQDAPVVDSILQQVSEHCYSFAGKLQLSETVDLMSMAHAVISNDSGLMHMASSLGKYVLAIYGSTSHTFTPPFGPAAKIITKNLSCSPCFKKDCPLGHHQCMTTITPQQIAELLAKDGL